MLKLGLGFGSPNCNTLQNTAATIANWGTWNGSNDGAITNIANAGGTGAQDIAMVSDTEAVMLYQAADNSSRAVVLDIVDKVVQPINTNTEITLTHADATGMNIVMLSPNKFLCLYEDTTDNEGVVVLLTKSGKTLTETDVHVLTGFTEANFQCCLTELTASKAAGIMKDRLDGLDGKVFIVDVTGDTISVGTLISIGDVNDYPAICKGQADGSGFFVGITDTGAQDSGIYYFSVSGTTATQEARIDVDAASTQYDDMMAAYIADGVCVMSYESQGGSTVAANAFYWNGSTLSRGTEVTAIFGTNNLFQGTSTVTELGNRQAMFSGRLEDDSQQGGAVVVTVDESLICTKGTAVTHFPSIQADHAVIDAAPSGLYVLAACQDETTTPIQQIATRVLQGF